MLSLTKSLALEPGACFLYQGKKGDIEPFEKFRAIIERTDVPASSAISDAPDSMVIQLRIHTPNRKSSSQVICSNGRCVVEEGGGSFSFSESPKQITLGFAEPAKFSKEEGRFKFPSSEVSRVLWKFKPTSKKLCFDLKSAELKEAKARYEKSQPEIDEKAKVPPNSK